MTNRETGLAAASMAALIALTAVACGGQAPGTAAPDGARRRSELRESLRLELGREYDLPLPALEEGEIVRGAEIYGTLCESCHGLAARGNGRSGRALATAPPDLADPAQAAFFSDRAKLRIVLAGSRGTTMIGWRQVLTEEECELVLRYMLDLASPQGAGRAGESR